MKFRTRLGVAFCTILLVPLVLSATLVFGMLKYQLHAIDETYGITGTTIENLSNSVQVMAKLTEQPYLELADVIHTDVEMMEDATFQMNLMTGWWTKMHICLYVEIITSLM